MTSTHQHKDANLRVGKMPLLLAVAVTFLLVLSGCGGAGARAGTGISPFIGHWVGASPGGNTIDVVIQETGHFAGTCHDSFLNLDGTLEGIVSDDGLVFALVRYPGLSDATVNGTVHKEAPGHLIGEGALTRDGVTTSGTIELTRL